MKLNIYAVLDTKAAHYGTPFFMPSDGMAIRTFGDLVNDDRSAINKHPEDYALYRLGEFENILGEVIPNRPLNLSTASSLIKIKYVNEKSIDEPVMAALLENNGQKQEVK